MKGSKLTPEGSSCHYLKDTVSQVTILDPLNAQGCRSPSTLPASQGKLGSTIDRLSRIIMSNCACAAMWMAVPVASLLALIPLYQPWDTFVVMDALSREAPEVVAMIHSAEVGTCAK